MIPSRVGSLLLILVSISSITALSSSSSSLSSSELVADLSTHLDRISRHVAYADSSSLSSTAQKLLQLGELLQAKVNGQIQGQGQAQVDEAAESETETETGTLDADLAHVRNFITYSDEDRNAADSFGITACAVKLAELGSQLLSRSRHQQAQAHPLVLLQQQQRQQGEADAHRFINGNNFGGLSPVLLQQQQQQQQQRTRVSGPPRVYEPGSSLLIQQRLVSRRLRNRNHRARYSDEDRNASDSYGITSCAVKLLETVGAVSRTRNMSSNSNNNMIETQQHF